jgi:hypothetical protein
MSEPDFGPSENAADNWPYSLPEQIRYAHQLDGATPGDTRPYEEWHYDNTLPGEPGGRDAPQELEPPPEWSGGGTFVPENGDQPAWDDPYQNQPARDDPYEPELYRPSSHRLNRVTLALARPGPAPAEPPPGQRYRGDCLGEGELEGDRRGTGTRAAAEGNEPENARRRETRGKAGEGGEPGRQTGGREVRPQTTRRGSGAARIYDAAGQARHVCADRA